MGRIKRTPKGKKHPPYGTFSYEHILYNNNLTDREKVFLMACLNNKDGYKVKVTKIYTLLGLSKKERETLSKGVKKKGFMRSYRTENGGWDHDFSEYGDLLPTSSIEEIKDMKRSTPESEHHNSTPEPKKEQPIEEPIAVQPVQTSEPVLIIPEPPIQAAGDVPQIFDPTKPSPEELNAFEVQLTALDVDSSLWSMLVQHYRDNYELMTTSMMREFIKEKLEEDDSD